MKETQTATLLRETPFNGHPHLHPQPTLQTCSSDIRANDNDVFMCDVFDLNDDDDVTTNIDCARPRISWRPLIQAKRKLKQGRGVGTDGLNAEVVQCIFNITAWASTSPKNVDPLSLSLSSEGQSNAEGGEAQD